MITITLPDGSKKEYESGVTALQVAEDISPRLAKEVLAATVNDQVVDPNSPY